MGLTGRQAVEKGEIAGSKYQNSLRILLINAQLWPIKVFQEIMPKSLETDVFPSER